jgi:hypothetical protein
MHAVRQMNVLEDIGCIRGQIGHSIGKDCCILGQDEEARNGM